MNVLELQSLGLVAKVENGTLRVAGFQVLPPAVAARVRQAVAEHRDTIIAELAAEVQKQDQPIVVDIENPAPVTSDCAKKQNAPATGQKPCDAHEGLPCHGCEGGCLGRPYWEAKTFDAHNPKRQAADLSECAHVARIEKWLADQPRPVAEPSAAPQTTAEPDADAQAAYAELLAKVRDGSLAMVVHLNGWPRPVLNGRDDALACQNLFQRALPALTAKHARGELDVLLRANTGDPEASTLEECPCSGRSSRIPPQARRNYKAALPWLRSHLKELLAIGFTPREVFGVGRLAYPYGWGIG